MQTFYELEYKQGNSKKALHTIQENSAMDCFDSIKNYSNEFTFKMFKSDDKGMDCGLKISYENYASKLLS